MQELAGLLHAAPDEAATPHLDEGILAAFSEGTLTAAARENALHHLARCARCRRDLAALHATLAAPAVRAALRPGRRLLAGGLIAAGAVAASLLVAVVPGRDGPDMHRASTLAPPVAVVAPLGGISGPVDFSWRPVAGADQYRITVFTADGVTAASAVIDSSPWAPAPGVLRPGLTYFWTVEARVARGRWASSPLVRFTIHDAP